MDPLEEGAEPDEPDRADQSQSRAEHDEKGDQDRRPERQVGDRVHSITSPRIRNLARATVDTKPSSAISSAASK